VAYTLAYYDTATITAIKSFKVQAPGVKIFEGKKLKNSFFIEKTFFADFEE
jgi:hypothetical protein